MARNERGGAFSGGPSLDADIVRNGPISDTVAGSTRDASPGSAFGSGSFSQAAETGSERAAGAAADSADRVDDIVAQLESLTVVATPIDPDPGEDVTVQFEYANGDLFGNPFTIPGGADGGFIVSEVAPTDPSEGDTWLDCDTGVQYVFFGGSWVQPSLPVVIARDSDLRKTTSRADVKIGDLSDTLSLTYVPTNFILTDGSLATIPNIPGPHTLSFNGLLLHEGIDYDYNPASTGTITLRPAARNAVQPIGTETAALILTIFRL